MIISSQVNNTFESTYVTLYHVQIQVYQIERSLVLII